MLLGCSCCLVAHVHLASAAKAACVEGSITGTCCWRINSRACEGRHASDCLTKRGAVRFEWMVRAAMCLGYVGHHRGARGEA